MIFKVTYRGSTVVSPDLEEEVILSWRTLRKLGVIHDLFPRPHPWAERVVKAIADKVARKTSFQCHLLETNMNKNYHKPGMLEPGVHRVHVHPQFLGDA